MTKVTALLSLMFISSTAMSDVSLCQSSLTSEKNLWSNYLSSLNSVPTDVVTIGEFNDRSEAIYQDLMACAKCDPASASTMYAENKFKCGHGKEIERDLSNLVHNVREFLSSAEIFDSRLEKAIDKKRFPRIHPLLSQILIEEIAVSDYYKTIKRSTGSVGLCTQYVSIGYCINGGSTTVAKPIGEASARVAHLLRLLPTATCERGLWPELSKKLFENGSDRLGYNSNMSMLVRNGDTVTATGQAAKNLYRGSLREIIYDVDVDSSAACRDLDLSVVKKYDPVKIFSRLHKQH